MVDMLQYVDAMLQNQPIVLSVSSILSERPLNGLVILNEALFLLPSEGSGRAARSVAFFATQQSRVRLASLSRPKH